MTTEEIVKRLRERPLSSGCGCVARMYVNDVFSQQAELSAAAADRLEALEVALNSAVNALENLGERAVNMEAENKRLRGLVRSAYNEGFGEGMREYTKSSGGKPWDESDARAALRGET
jgi:hypothetical protein